MSQTVKYQENSSVASANEKEHLSIYEEPSVALSFEDRDNQFNLVKDSKEAPIDEKGTISLSIGSRTSVTLGYED
jgi:hypothetical protein